MATDTYIQMVSDMITETGLNAGNPPPTIATATGDAAKVAYWIRVADLTIQRERIDWDFLWQKDTVDLVAGSSVVPSPTYTYDNSTPTQQTLTSTRLINVIAKDRLAIIDSNGEAHFPCYMDWNEFSVVYDYQSQTATDYPSFWTITPAREIRLSSPVETSGLTCKYEYWRKPLRLRNDADTSRIPDDFNRLIIVRAKIMYAEHEDAPEVSMGSHEEYEHMMSEMMSVHLPETEWHRMENSDRLMMVTSE